MKNNTYFCTMNDKSITRLPDFSDLHIVVIGDIMIDRYISGSVKRISPEAPVPVVDMDHVENKLGGAANVAVNLLALGAKVTLVSISGDDAEGDYIQQLCADQNQLNHKILRIPGRKTTIKSASWQEISTCCA
jgi:bifunctional ADP-heptose synthase (sugar kinase/adenylyltransferase)